MITRRSSSSGQIGPPAVELHALESLKIPPQTYIGKKVASCLFLSNPFLYLQVIKLE